MIKRDYYLKRLIDSLNFKKIKIITGIRRCGKSYLLFTIFKESPGDTNITFFTFEVLTKADKVAQCKEPFYQRRYRNQSITQSKVTEKNYISSTIVYRELVSFSEREGIFDNNSVQKYIARCAYRFIDIYSRLSKNDKGKNRQLYQRIIDDVKKHDGFGDKALIQRCKSKFRWGVYKAMTKLKVWR